MGSLNPAAEEFRPRNPNHGAPPATLLSPNHSKSYHPTGELQTVSFFYTRGVVPFDVVLVPYPQTQLSPPPLALSSTSSTRSLLLSFVPSSDTVVSESVLRRELEVFGDVRGVQMERLREGMVTVHFYDLRHAETALTALRNPHYAPLTVFNGTHGSLSSDEVCALPLQARGLVAVWAQYILPASDAVPDGHNQGTIVVFNLDSEVDDESLRQIFEAFGPVKEFRHTPLKKSQRFVEFFDIRDAANALKQMDGKEIHGKPAVVKFSRPGKFFHVDAASTISKSKSPSSMPFSPSTPLKFRPRSQSQLASTGSHEKTNSIKKHGNESRVQSTKHQSRHWRGKHAKKYTRFLIKEDAIVESVGCIDSRTTLMIKNIPNKYSQKLLLNMLDNHCIHSNVDQIGDGNDQVSSSYDLVYLPIDFNNKCNVGYGFVNMTSLEATLRLYRAFHLQPWEVFNSRKICEVTYARVQGLEALREHFKNSKFPYEMEQYLPVVFSLPRDGKQLTEPLPIGHNNKHRNMTIDHDLVLQLIGPHREEGLLSSDDLLN